MQKAEYLEKEVGRSRLLLAVVPPCWRSFGNKKRSKKGMSKGASGVRRGSPLAARIGSSFFALGRLQGIASYPVGECKQPPVRA